MEKSVASFKPHESVGLVCLMLLWLAFLVASAAAKDHFVDASGKGGDPDDGNAGTRSEPLKTVGEAVRRTGGKDPTIRPGDTVYFRKGSYSAFRLDGLKGEADRPYVFRAWENEDVLIEGDESGIRLDNCEHVHLIGFEVTGATANYSGGIRIQGGRHNRVERCHVHHNSAGKGTMGVLIADSSFNKILHNEIHDNSLSGIMVSSSKGQVSAGNELIANHIYRHKKGKGDADGISVNGERTAGRDSYPSATWIEGNTIHDNADDGIDTWNTRDNRVIGNVCFNHGDGGDGCGFKLGGGGEGDDAGFNYVAFNVAYANTYAGFDCNGSGGTILFHNVAHDNAYGFLDTWRIAGQSADGVTLINNIGSNNRKTNLELFTNQNGTICDYNLWFDDRRGAKVKFAKQGMLGTIEKFTQVSGFGAHSISAAPRFIDPPNGDFRLSELSPARDAGDPRNPAGVKLRGTAPDIGAFETAAMESSVQPRSPQVSIPELHRPREHAEMGLPVRGSCTAPATPGAAPCHPRP